MNKIKTEIINNANIKNKDVSQSGNETNNKVEKEDEDDVWILGSMFDAVSNRASVGIFDGKNVSKGKK